MTTSHDSEVRHGNVDRRSVLRRLTGLSRYDLVLLSIPFAFLASLLASLLLGVSVEGAISGGALLALAVLVDALYIRPPTGRSRGRTSP